MDDVMQNSYRCGDPTTSIVYPCLLSPGPTSLFQRPVRLAVVECLKLRELLGVVGRLGCSAKVEHTSTDV